MEDSLQDNFASVAPSSSISDAGSGYIPVDVHASEAVGPGGVSDHLELSPRSNVPGPSSVCSSLHTDMARTEDLTESMYDDASVQQDVDGYDEEDVDMLSSTSDTDLNAADAHLHYRISVSTCATSDATSISSLDSSEDGNGLIPSTSQASSFEHSPAAGQQSLDESLETQTSAVSSTGSGLSLIHI